MTFSRCHLSKSATRVFDTARMHRNSIKRAAQYLRMSTDMQQYSLLNQAAAIALYAAGRGFEIVRTYEDAGKSGLKIDTRSALKALIDDVRSGRADFKAVLVYDVSRWGRFQDIDESAYYEFICKEAGVAIEYCAEQFANDGSLIATVMKNIKRAMAGEFSRELSVKVHAGISRVASLGFHSGSTPGYGLRRALLDESGRWKMDLSFGQQKSLRTERTVLRPGPKNEIDTIRHVYNQFIDQKLPIRDIAADLNSRGIVNAWGRPWNFMSIRDLLTNEKYIGNAVFNRT